MTTVSKIQVLFFAIFLLLLHNAGYGMFKQNATNTSNTNGARKYIDRPNLHIIKGYYVSGSLYFEVNENKLTRLDRWKEYYENGQLKKEGYMTNASHINIGVWTYYSSAGKIDSIVDYDKKYPISYDLALKIAKSKGFAFPDMEVQLTQVDSKVFWQMTRWTAKKTGYGSSGEEILIDVNSGLVTRPKGQLIGIH